jgi:hypothetical protein
MNISIYGLYKPTFNEIICMKRYLLSAFFALFFAITASAQDQVIICRGVSDDGKPLGANNSFVFFNKPASVYVLINLEEPVGYYRVVVKLYHVVDGRETYDNAFTLSTELDWMYFWQEVVFERDNDYKIYAYKGDREVLIGTADLSVRFK